MQVRHLSVHAFEGLHGFDAPLEPLTLVCGPNHCGKSSLLEAVRFALTGVVDRVKLKRDYPLLVTEGAAKSRIAVVLDNGEEVAATLPTGKHVPPIEPGSAAALALDPPRFMQLSDDERKTLLYQLAGDHGDVMDLARERLQKLGVDPKRMSRILPSLRAGFPEAFKQASEEAAQARAAWRGVTGEPYGVQKAEGWRPSTPVTAPTEEEIAEAMAERAAAREAVKAAAERVGQLNALLDPDQREALKVLADRLPQLEQNVQAGEAELLDLKARRDELVQVAAQSTGICFDCPCCGKPLRYAGGVASERTADVGEATKAAAELQTLQRQIDAAEQHLGTLRPRLRSAREAAERLAAAGSETDAAANAAARQALADAEQRQDDAEQAWKRIEERQRHVAELERKAALAADWHAAAKEWAAVAEVFSPNGLPQELLGWALKPVNDSLRHGPDGWPVVQIRGDMTLTVGGRPYWLCSESEQWRADVLMAAWLAERAGTGLVLVDRMDVLDPASRMPFLEWMADRTEAGTHQFIVAATLNTAPNLDYARVFWMGAPALENAA